jgi:hypothetical protein
MNRHDGETYGRGRIRGAGGRQRHSKKADGKETILPLLKLSEAHQEIASKLASAAKPNPGETISAEDEDHIAAINKFSSDFTHLNFGGTKVTDAGLVHLKGMTGLRRLNLSETKVTDAGVAKLRPALPNCNILK